MVLQFVRTILIPDLHVCCKYCDTSQIKADTMRNTYLYDGQTRNIFRVFIWKIFGQRQLRKVRKDLKGGGVAEKREGRNQWSLAVCVRAVEPSRSYYQRDEFCDESYKCPHFDRKQIPVFLKNEFMALPCCVCVVVPTENVNNLTIFSQIWYPRYANVRLCMFLLTLAQWVPWALFIGVNRLGREAGH